MVHGNTHGNTQPEYMICKELLVLCVVKDSEFKISVHHYLTINACIFRTF